MSDIVERLRRRPEWTRAGERDRLCAEAADEIERLCAENEQLRARLETAVFVEPDLEPLPEDELLKIIRGEK